jgi:hypothetical protein
MCTYKLENFEFYFNDPWQQILSNCAWVIRSTTHCMLDASPAQTVFGRDMLIDLSVTTNFKELKITNKKLQL